MKIFDRNKNKDSVGLVFFFLGSPPIIYTFISIWKIKKRNILLKAMSTLRSVKDVEFQVLVLLELISNLKSVENYIQFQGFLRLHAIGSNSENLEADWMGLLNSGETANSDEEFQKQKMKVNNFMIFYFQKVLDLYPRSIKIRILKAHFEFWEIGVYWSSVYTLMKIPDLDPTVPEQFCSVSCSSQVEVKLSKMDNEEVKRSGFDIKKMISYRDSFLNFLKLINKTVRNHLEFWKELADENPDANKLLEIGDKITSRHEILNDNYRALSSIDLANVKYHFIYIAFLRDVAHDEESCANLMEDMRFTKNVYTGYKTEEDLDADNMVVLRESCVVYVSGNRQIFGHVLGVCNQIKGMLGYQANEVVGQNVELIMPAYFAQKHEGFMKNFFDSGKQNVVNKNRIVFPKTKQGHIKHCKLRLRIIPDLENGIRLLGVITHVNKKDLGKALLKKYFNLELFYLVYNSSTGQIIGVSKTCDEHFGLNPILFEKTTSNSPVIQLIFPEILQNSSKKELTGEGFDTYIDTTMLLDNYFYVGDEDKKPDDINKSKANKEGNDIHSSFNFMNSSEFSENEKNQKFRRCRVRAWIAESSDYGDGEINCLRFIKNEEDNLKFEADVVQYERSLDNEKNKLLTEDQSRSKSKSGKTSVGDESFDQERLIKETKASISEKKTPESLGSLRNYLILILILATCYAGFTYWYKKKFNELTLQSILFSKGIHSRNTAIADSRFYIRKLELVANGIIQDETGTESQRLIDNLHKISNELEDYQIDSAETLSFRDIQSGDEKIFKYPIYMKMKQGDDLTTELTYSDAVYQYIASISMIINSKIEKLLREKTKTEELTSERIHFLRIITNSLNSLRIGGEEIVEFYNKFVVTVLNEHLKQIQLVYIYYFGFFFISMIIIIPLTLKVSHSDQDVLALFGMISLLDIQDISENIHKFKNEFIDEYIDDEVIKDIIDREEFEGYQSWSEDDNISEKEEVKENLQIKENEEFEFESDDEIKEERLGDDLMSNIPGEVINTEYDQLSVRNENAVKNTVRGAGYKAKTLISKNPDNDKELEALRKKSRRKTSGDQIKKKKLVKNKKQQQEELFKKHKNNIMNRKYNSKRSKKIRKSLSVKVKDEHHNESNDSFSSSSNRIEKLKSSMTKKTDSVSCLTIALISGFSLLFFLALYFFEINNTTNFKSLSQYFFTLGLTPTVIKNTFNLMYESFSLSESPLLINGKDAFSEVKDESYDLIALLTSTDSQIKSILFSDYRTMIDGYMFGNICNDFITKIQKNSTCSSELYSKGLETISVYVLENSRKMLNTYDSLKKSIPNENEVILRSTDMKILGEVYEYMIGIMILEINKGFTRAELVNKLILGLSIFCFFTSVGLFQKLVVGKIKVKLWRSRGMVAIIPIEIIKKNHVMADLFLKKSKEKQEEDRRKRSLRKRKRVHRG